MSVALINEIPWLGRRDLVDRYQAAIAHGANETQSEAETEALHTPTRLIALAINRIPDLASYASWIQLGLVTEGYNDPFSGVPVAMKARAAGALRLAHRALEVHARDFPYDPTEWEEDVFVGYEAIVCAAQDRDPAATVPGAYQLVREATMYLTRAVSALENDRLGLPAHLGGALSRLFALYLLAEKLTR